MKILVLFISIFGFFIQPGLSENASLAHIQRTMGRIASSTQANPETIRWMFYGQSITSQAWTKIVTKSLEERFPSVKFNFHKPSIGGFTSPKLIRTAEHDLYPWYPDLLVFHVYGPTDKYEEIIRTVRSRTTAEIVLWTSHLSGHETLDKNPDNDGRTRAIRDIAQKYDCMLVDIRKKWIAHLKEHKLEPSAFLRDNVHLNKDGEKLLGEFMAAELKPLPKSSTTTQAGSVTHLAANSKAIRHDPKTGTYTLKFNGNRVVAISNGKESTSTLNLTLNHQAISQQISLWAATRPSKAPSMWMPAIKQVSFQQTPLEENWTLTCLPDSSLDGKTIHFKVTGSKTGDDGEGYSDKPFISKSGRVVIQPEDWHLAWCLQYKKLELPKDFKVTWKTYPTFTESYGNQPKDTETVLVQHCDNQDNQLIFSDHPKKFGIQSFKVYTPSKNLGQQN